MFEKVSTDAGFIRGEHDVLAFWKSARIFDELRDQNGFDCQGLWVEVEVEKELGLGTKNAIVAHGMERFVDACKKRVLTFAARQTEQSVRLGYWMDWDDPATLRKLAGAIGKPEQVTVTVPSGKK